MKVKINYLPEHKQDELRKIVSITTDAYPVEMIILFGSYARNDWVEDMYDDEHYRYQSDIDILVIVETRGINTQNEIEQELETKIEQDEQIKTPVSIIVHDIDYINVHLKKTQYFFSDIKKEGVLLHDSKNHQLESPRKLRSLERKQLAQDDFDYYFKEADDFKEGVEFYLSRGKLNKAVFLLHQETEWIYAAVLLIFTRYKPKLHDLAALRKLTNALSNGLISVFPVDNGNVNERRLFKLLRKAYVDARYKPSYKITRDELTQLIERVEKLDKIGRTICLRKIESFC